MRTIRSFIGFFKEVGQKFLKYRFLFEELVKRDFKKKYKRTLLGVLWSLLAPMLQLGVMALVFTNFFGRTTPHYIVYLFSGNLVYSYFSQSTTSGMTALENNAGIISKINVPKYMFLLSHNVASLINFLLTLIIYFIFVIADGLGMHWSYLTLIYPIVCLMFFNIGMGLILSALHMVFKDLSYLYSIFTMLIMYMSAVFYQVTTFPAEVQGLFFINPIYDYIYYFRSVVINGVIPNLTHHAICLGYPVLVMTIGMIMYHKMNYKFLYYI